jgi:endonuclease YncB( thermonuclease family)
LSIRYSRFLLALIFLISQLALAREPVGTVLEGEVVGITDGDTLTLLLPEKRQLKIRLAEIDTPERRQPYYQKAKQALADRVFSETVTIEIVDWDRYGRAVGKIRLNGQYVNAWMVAEGHAWVYRKYSDDPKLMELEAQAKQTRRGIWALPETDRVPPWEWRSGSRGNTKPDTAVGQPYTCGSKRYCRDMGSCDEAMFYLRQCGLSRLDGDKDSVPCESICR